MSGWGGYEWSTIALGGYFFAIGAMNFLPRRLEETPEPAWLVEARQLHGQGVAVPPPAPSRGWEIAAGVAFLFLGGLQFTSRHPVAFDRVFLLGLGALMLAAGIVMLVFQLRPRRSGDGWWARRRRRKLERRLARGTDAYADELRSLLAPAPQARVLSPGWRLVGAILFTLLGGGLLAAGLATPR